MLHAFCVKEGNRYSAECVDVLHDMLRRNLPDGLAGDFTCYTDNPKGIAPGIIVRSLNDHAPTKDFIRFGLNMVITGPLDDIVRDLPLLEKPYPKGVASYSEVWESVPQDISIVVFDGDEIPSDVKLGWVPMIYKIGGGTPASFVFQINTPESKIRENILSAMSRDAKWLSPDESRAGEVLICAGGPSLKDSLASIAARKKAGAVIYAVNGSFNYLLSVGIEPDAHVMVDAREENTVFLPDLDIPAERLYASQCHPTVIDGAGKNLTLWHPHFHEVQEIVGEKALFVGGGGTAGLKAIIISHLRGYRKIHLYGFDSSYQDGENHAYPQPLNDGENVLDAIVDGKSFRAAPWMIAQVEDFKAILPQLMAAGVEFTIHGEGLLPTVAHLMTQQDRVLTAVYDLASSPPTYEIVGFLSEAEKARIEGGYTALDIVFQPGPDGGFRADNLPPDTVNREGMLWRVCVAACRLLPSARNISVLRKREAIKGAVFPPNWSLNKPVAHYGAHYCQAMKPILSASKVAVDYIASRYPEPFVCITLRNSDYWPGRNSDFDAWLRISRLFERDGIKVVFVPDLNGAVPEGSNLSCPEASYDLDIRAALYEGAILCLGVSSGTTGLMAMVKCDYLVFHKADPAYPFKFAQIQMSDHGKQVWGNSDDYDTIRAEIVPWISQYLKHRMAA